VHGYNVVKNESGKVVFIKRVDFPVEWASVAWGGGGLRSDERGRRRCWANARPSPGTL